MKKLWMLIVALAVLTACEEEKKPAAQESGIIRNLPTQDRDFLLEPLEAALDDLRKLADDNDALTEETYAIDTLGWKGKKVLGLYEEDTVRLYIEIQQPQKREYHWRYWDDESELYYMESTIQYLNPDGGVNDQVAYRLYLEEGGVLISSYGRKAFGGGDLPEAWRATEFSPEELTYLLRVAQRF
jgi:hypothetical protein